VRASDDERETVVARLQSACAEGRLTLEDLGARVSGAYSAVYRADLVPLVADLPPPSAVGATGAARVEAARARRPERVIVGIMSSITRRGRWRLPRKATVVSVLGEVDLDLRHAVVDSPTIDLRLVALLGQVRVRVPEGVEVDVRGPALLGERHVDVRATPPRPGMPTLHLHVAVLLGGVRVTDR
jgi:hypothetical protein